MTLEISWAVPATTAIPEGEAFPLDLELTEGRVVEALTCSERVQGAPERLLEGGWRLGVRRSGRVRARIEAATGANLLFRAGGQVIRVPVPLVLEGRQHTPPQTPVEIEVERVPWDSISVALADGDGTVGPGAKVPLFVGFNALTPETTDLALRCVAELRPAKGGEA